MKQAPRPSERGTAAVCVASGSLEVEQTVDFFDDVEQAVDVFNPYSKVSSELMKPGVPCGPHSLFDAADARMFPNFTSTVSL